MKNVQNVQYVNIESDEEDINASQATHDNEPELVKSVDENAEEQEREYRSQQVHVNADSHQDEIETYQQDIQHVQYHDIEIDQEVVEHDNVEEGQQDHITTDDNLFYLEESQISNWKFLCWIYCSLIGCRNSLKAKQIN